MVAPRWIPTLCIVLLVGGALLAALLFGAVGELPLPRGGPRLDVRHLFEAFVLACAAVALLAAPAERRPRGVWFAATLALPAWAALSLLPLPVGVIEHLAPARAGIVQAAPPGPLEGCDGPLIGPGPPAAATLTSDATLTRQQTFHYAAGALAFLAAFSYFPGRRRRLLALTVTLAALGLAESVYGLWQWASGTPMVLWQEKTAYVDSATGTLINRNHFAQLVYVGLAATLALLFRPRPAGTDPVGRERAMALRVALGLAVATELAAILASRSRAGLGCAALVLAAGGIAWVRRHGRLRLFELVLAAAIFLPLAVVTVPPVVERLAALPAEWTAAAGRGEVYRTSMRIVAEHPLFGTGAGTFALIWGRYRPPAIQGAYNYAHNDYLQVLIETGIPGLLAALAPIVLFAVVTWRRRRTQPLDDPVSLPLFAALGAVALHEVIDFGLQIPSNLVLVGLLAGALAPPPLVSTAGRGGRVAVAVAVLALLLAPLAALHSLARWPGLGERVPWPDPPSVAHRRAGEAFDRWRAARTSDPVTARADACACLEHEAGAIAARPLSATYRTGYATRAGAMLADGVFGDRREAAEQAIATAADRARLLDPWNARHRNRLLRVALALGRFDRAYADAEAVAHADTVSRRMVRDLLDLGLPPAMVARIAESRPVPYRELLATLWKARDRETLAWLVPPDVAADPVRCFAGGQVRAVLRRIHGRSARPFLEACLELAEREQDEQTRTRRRDEVLAWLALDAIDEHDLAGAAAFVDRMAPGIRRDEMALRLAQLRRDWDAVARLAQALLYARRGALAPQTAARYHTLIAESLARRGRYGDALTALRRALYYDRANPRLQRWVRELEDGNDPFPPLPPEQGADAGTR